MNATPVRLLLLEDNADDAELLRLDLTGSCPGEFAVTRVERLADALVRLDSEPFDAVLCDLGLPDSTGPATVKAISQHAPELPLVVLTGLDDDDIGHAAIQQGAQDYLVKQHASGALMARTLRYAIERKRLEAGLKVANEALARRVAERTAELEAANAALRANAARDRALMQTAIAGIITADADGRILGWNGVAEHMFGYAESEVLGQSLTRLMPPRYRDGHIAGLRRLRDGGERHAMGRTVELHGLTRSGAEFPLELSLSEWETSEGRYFTGIVRDITERKRAEQALRAAEEQFRGLVEQSIAGAYIIQDGKFAYVNPRFAGIFGYGTAEEIVGSDPLAVVAVKDRDRVEGNMRDLISGEVESRSYDFKGVRKDGTMIEVGVHGARATHRDRPAVIGLIQDISEKKRAEEQVQRHLAQLEAAFMSTVQVAATLSEMRDPYTGGHERRVAEIAVAIGIELGLDDRRIEGLRVAGYLHDIGKITIPSEILSKPGRLSAIEYRLIQGHSQASHDVLKPVEFPWPVAKIVLQHHERMDGSGYPQGLTGEAILLEARIVAVADVMEAMSSHRPYRPGLGIVNALAEIERGRGSGYDPEVADACLKLFREKGFVIPAESTWGARAG